MRERLKTDIQLQLTTLKDLYDKARHHHIGNVMEVLPFIAGKANPPIRGRYYEVFGDFVRNISELEFEDKSNKVTGVSFTPSKLAEQLIKDIEFHNKEDQHDFSRFIEAYLFDKDTIKPIHPFIYNYMHSEKRYQREMEKYGDFLYDILITSNDRIKRIFNNKTTDDLLTEIILAQISSLKSINKGRKQRFQNLLPIIGEMYQSDLLYLSNHKKYFLEIFPLLTHFYTFMYVCQLILKFEQFTHANFDKLDAFYFALDWESVSRRRDAASGPGSFKYIKEQSVNLFPHVHAMSHLSHNTANNLKNDKLSFLTYPELFLLATKQSDQNESLFLNSVNDWIVHYSKLGFLRNKVVINKDSLSIEEVFRELHGAIKQGMSKTSSERYGAHVEHLGVGQFIKSRGSLGFVFNLTHEFLLLLTTVCVRDERMPLNELFKEYRKRGIDLDWRSKKGIIQFLDQLNFIDKKSDSGDAQYVKPIL